MRNGRGQYFWAMLLMVLLAVSSVATSWALTSQSPNFEVSEPEFGAGAALETCSGEYCARATIGNPVTADEARSPSTASFSRLTTESEPLLEVIVEPGESNLGVLSTERTATSEALIKVRSYLSDGYTLQINGTPPKYGSYTMQTPSTPVDSQPGSEQFGINLAANTTPAIGADPVQLPSSDFSFGQVTAAYATANKFMYRSGDVVARSDSESGQTEYTVSMIVNVATSTPAGHFSGDFSVTVIPTF